MSKKRRQRVKRLMGYEVVILVILFMLGSVFTFYAVDAMQTTTRWSNGVALVPEIINVIDEYANKRYDAYIERYDPSTKHLVIRISGNDASDGSCQYVAEFFHKLCSIGVTLEVNGDFVPSKKNPMTLAWTKQLTVGQY